MDVSWRRVAAYVVCRDAIGRLLLTRFFSPEHPDSGKWTMPGGAMEWGESPAETALRELEEETGLTAVLGPVVGIYSQWFSEVDSVLGEPGHVVGVVFSALSVSGNVRTEFEEGTTDAAQWFTFEEVAQIERVPLVDFVLTLIYD